MSETDLTQQEREFILGVVEVYEKRVLPENPELSLPFRVFAQTALARRQCALGPLLSSELRERVQRTALTNKLTPKSAMELHSAIARELVPDDTLRRIPAISCPLIPIETGTTIPGTNEPCCTEREIGPGCGAGAGRVYNAKTDGRSVWYAANMFQRESAGRGENFGAFGLTVRSKAAHVLLHEMGHVLHLNASTHLLFERVERWYWKAALLVPLRLREQKKIVVDISDSIEFVATAFAMDNENDVTRQCA